MRGEGGNASGDSRYVTRDAKPSVRERGGVRLENGWEEGHKEEHLKWKKACVLGDKLVG